MQYVPYNELGERPNIIVDGAANPHTVLTLSHWPESGTPDRLKDDSSTQIVFHYLDHPDLHVNADAVSNNHFDEDGLIGVYTLLNPAEAQSRRDFLNDIAAAGDFGTYRTRDAARVTFVISAFADAQRSPFDPAMFKLSYPRQAARLYEEMLPRIPDILNGLDPFRPYWEAEDAALSESEAMIRDGRVQIAEIPNLDLAIVTQNAGPPCHPMALHNAIRSFRVLVMQGHKYELRYRYESWVQYVSRKPLPRVDLTPLAEQLSEKESGNRRWTFDGVDEITPRLALDGDEESRVPPPAFIDLIKGYLMKAL
jgi:hypothetical protein